MIKIFLGGYYQSGHGQSGHGSLKLTVSQKRIDGITDFLHAGTSSGKPKVDSTICGWAWSKIAVVF